MKIKKVAAIAEVVSAKGFADVLIEVAEVVSAKGFADVLIEVKPHLSDPFNELIDSR
jgi:hypothetical protein